MTQLAGKDKQSFADDMYFKIGLKTFAVFTEKHNEIPFFPMENIFFQIIWWIHKFEKMKYLIHYGKFEMWTALFYVNYLSDFYQWNLN